MPAHTVDLEPHRAWIVAEVQAGRTLDYICSHLPVHGSCSVSTRTLKRRLDAWGIRNQETGENGERRRTRREAGLGQAKPTIIDLYVQGRPMKAIQAEVRRQSGIQLSERRLHSLLHEWEVPPRRERAHAPDVHEVVATLAQDGLPVSQIRRYLEVELQVHRSASWVLRLLQSMAIPPPRFWDVAHVSDEDAPAIMGYIADTFYESKQTDSDVQDQLEAMGFRVSLRQIFVFRKQMGLFRKLHRQQADDSLEQLRQFLVDSPRADLLAPRLTKKLLPVFFKQEFKLSISRAMAWRFMQEHYAADMLERIRHLARRRSGFLCPGPNYIWSIDAYCKLQHWGFEVYACIDAYSRYIVWAHVGHTSQTQRSVCLQYVDVVRERGFLPLIIRSDHGVETGMIAGAHYWLSAASTERRLLKPTRDEDGNVVWIYREMQGDMEVRQVVHAGEGQDVPPPRFGPWRQLEFHECYSYGVSTKNQRIESWWQQLNYHVSGLWRVSPPHGPAACFTASSRRKSDHHDPSTTYLVLNFNRTDEHPALGLLYLPGKEPGMVRVSHSRPHRRALHLSPTDPLGGWQVCGRMEQPHDSCTEEQATHRAGYPVAQLPRARHQY